MLFTKMRRNTWERDEGKVVSIHSLKHWEQVPRIPKCKVTIFVFGFFAVKIDFNYVKFNKA